MNEKAYNPERCEWHEDQMRATDRRLGRVEKALFTTNGEPGLIETVRGIAKVQRWQSVALLILLLLQVQAPVRDLLAQVLRQLVTP